MNEFHVRGCRDCGIPFTNLLSKQGHFPKIRADMEIRYDIFLFIGALFNDLHGATANKVEAIFIIARLKDDLILFEGFKRRISNRLMKFL